MPSVAMGGGNVACLSCNLSGSFALPLAVYSKLTPESVRLISVLLRGYVREVHLVPREERDRWSKLDRYSSDDKSRTTHSSYAETCTRAWTPKMGSWPPRFRPWSADGSQRTPAKASSARAQTNNERQHPVGCARSEEHACRR